MQIEEICGDLLSNALSALALRGPVFQTEKRIDELVEKHFVDCKDIKPDSDENLCKFLRAVGRMLLEETK